MTGKFGLVVFDALPGHRVSGNFINVTIPNSATIYAPTGATAGACGAHK